MVGEIRSTTSGMIALRENAIPAIDKIVIDDLESLHHRREQPQ